MFHKVKSVAPLTDYKLSVQFCEGVTKLYDVKPLISTIPEFQYLSDKPEGFGCVCVDVGGYGIVWNDNLELLYRLRLMASWHSVMLLSYGV